MPCSIQCRQHRRYTCRSCPVWTRCNTGFALFHRTNRHYLGCVGYVCVGRRWSYQNRGETLLGQGRVCFGDFKYPHWLPEIAYPNFNDCFSSTAHIHNDNLIMFNLHYMWGDFKTICRLCKYNNVTKFVIYGKKEAGTGEHSTHFNNKINKHKWKAAAPHGRLPHTKHKLKSRPGPLSSSTVVTPHLTLPKLLRGTRDRWVVQVSFITNYSTGLAPFPRLSAPPHSSQTSCKISEVPVTCY